MGPRLADAPISLPGGRETPFLNLLGNHDVLAMGNFDEHGPVRTKGVEPDNRCVCSLERLKETLAELRDELAAGPGGRPVDPRVLGAGTREEGYYRVDRRLPDGRSLRLLMLHTNESNILDPLFPGLQKGALYPSIGERQLAWVTRELDDAHAPASDVAAVLVFGHNDLAEVTINRTNDRSDRDSTFGEFAALLGRYPKVKAYFGGHLHVGCRPVRWKFPAHEFDEFLQPSIQEYPKCGSVVTLRPDPRTGELAIWVRYFNIEDLIDVSGSRDLDVTDGGSEPGDQEKFRNWLKDLNAAAPRTRDRVRRLAEYCYRGSIYDVPHDLREDIGIAFHPAFAAKLLEIYKDADDFWRALKSDRLVWADHRRLLGGEDPLALPRASKP